MWFKQAANSMWNATKNILADKRSPGKRLLDEIVQSNEEIIPTNKLNELSALTYDIESFLEIVDICIERIRVFKYDLEQARKSLNMLITINYLLKHGATAFVDELRQYINTFKKYQALEPLRTYQQETKQQSLNYELQKIKSRANHIQTLLQDKQKLLKEKQLSMLVKQKLKIYEKQKISQLKTNIQHKGNLDNKGNNHANQLSQHQDRMGKLQWMLQKYLWQYVDKVDGKLQEISDKVLTQIDKYIIGVQQIPQTFQLQDEDEQSAQPRRENTKDSSGNKILDDKQDELMKRLQEEGMGESLQQQNLLQFQQVIQEQIKTVVKKVDHESLI